MSFEFLNRGSSEGEIRVSPIDTFIDPVSKIRVSQPGNLIDTDFEYGLQPTKWETVELINNTPAFFSKGGDTSIPDIISITTTGGTREITVVTAFPHNLAVGIPIRVAGTKSVTADGSYIINAVPSPTTLTYLCRSPQQTTVSIYDLYTSVITGEFFQGSQISISDSEGITTNGEAPNSSLTVKTKNKHGFGPKTPFYFLNLNSTVAQEFESQNSSSVSFDPTNSATARAFDGSNTLLQTPIDFSNSATTSPLNNLHSIGNKNLENRTVTMVRSQDSADDFTNLKNGDPLYYSLAGATDTYLIQNPRGVLFVKNLQNITASQATFQITQFPDGEALEISSSLSGSFQIADLARTFAGNNSDPSTEIIVDVIKSQDFLFDGANQGYDGDPETIINGVGEIDGTLGDLITVVSTDEATGELDYYVGAMVKYSTTGTPFTNLVNDGTYFVTSFAEDAPGLYKLRLAELPGGANITINTAGAEGSQLLSKIGVAIDKDILHIRNSNFDLGDMVEYVHPVGGALSSSYNKKYFFVKEDFGDGHNYRFTDKSYFAPPGQAEFTVPGTYIWTAPVGVYEVSAVTIGGGGGAGTHTSGAGGGGGGGLGWANNITVVPGQNYTVIVGAGGPRTTATTNSPGGDSYFISTSTVAGFGGAGGTGNTNNTAPGGGHFGDGGGNGGTGGRRANTSTAGGGGGAGGYSGNGGNGGSNNAQPTAGSGGGAGGGGQAGSGDTAGSGGGVGIFGQGGNGAAAVNSGSDAGGGGGGSGGSNASDFGTTSGNFYNNSTRKSIPGSFGGGAGGSDTVTNATTNEVSPGAGGAVRIIWGEGRAFPSTRTADE